MDKLQATKLARVSLKEIGLIFIDNAHIYSVFISFGIVDDKIF